MPKNCHKGITCDSCKKKDFAGRRYKCLACYQFNLCADCYDKDVTTNDHLFDHPVVVVYTSEDIELFFGGEILENNMAPQSFRCPYCKKWGFELDDFELHIKENHPDANGNIIEALRMYL